MGGGEEEEDDFEFSPLVSHTRPAGGGFSPRASGGSSKGSPGAGPGSPSSGKGPLKEVNNRLTKLETLLGTLGDDSAGGDGGTGGTQRIPLARVGDELRRLKTRFEYLERLTPQDVRRSLDFFEPLRDEQMGSSNGFGAGASNGFDRAGSSAAQVVGSAAVLRHVKDLEEKHSEFAMEAQELAQDGRREVMNVTHALRGLQRDSEMGSAKLIDLKKEVKQMRTRVETVLPQALRVIDAVLKKAGVDGGAENVESLRALVAEGIDSTETPHPFVCQSIFQKAFEDLNGDVQSGLAKVNKDVSALQGRKADFDALQDVSEKLATIQHQQLPAMKRYVQESIMAAMAESVADSAAGLHGGQYRPGQRCMSCDTLVDPRGTVGWPTSPPVGQAPRLPPGQAISGKDLRPMGAGVPRNISLPSLTQNRPKPDSGSGAKGSGGSVGPMLH